MNLVEILNKYQVPNVGPPHRHCRQGWWAVDCYQCSPGSGKFRLGFNLTSGASNCWICGKQDSTRSLAILCRVPYRIAAELWDRKSNTQYTGNLPHTGVLALPKAGLLLPAHRNYLQNERGFDPDEIQRIWSIQGIGPGSGKMQWRILIPIHDQAGRIVSWTTRSISNNPDVPRYISASPEEESVPHKSILYGSHLAGHSIVVCEGPLSAWAIGAGAAATLGVGYSEDQLMWMSRYPSRAICFDAEGPAQRRAEKLCRDLAVMPGVTENIVLESGKDPAECEESELAEIRRRFLF